MPPVSGTALTNRMPAVGMFSVLTTSSGLQAFTAPAARQSMEIGKKDRITDSMEVELPSRRLRPHPAR